MTTKSYFYSTAFHPMASLTDTKMMWIQTGGSTGASLNTMIKPSEETDDIHMPCLFLLLWEGSGLGVLRMRSTLSLTCRVRCICDYREDVLQDVAEVRLIEALSCSFLLGHILQQRVQDLQT